MALLGNDPTKLGTDLEKTIGRGRGRHSQIKAPNNESWAFFRGNHYAYVDEKNALRFLPTVTTIRGTGKPGQRARQKRNLIFDVVLRLAASATSRVPSYQVVPSTGDPDDQSAAKLAEKVLLYGYREWKVRQTVVEMVEHALVTGEGFCWPFFDNTVGDYLEGGLATGDVRYRVFGANECFWEPGLRFDASPWHCVEHARPVERVKNQEGFIGKDLKPDADAGKGESKSNTKLVLVTEYLECPTPNNPDGRWVTMANNRRILEDRPYPGSEQVLRKLSYAPDPDNDRDLGLVDQLKDAQRTFNDANNKAVEWKNHCLLPRLITTPGLFKRQRWTDEPGKVYEIPQPNENVKVVETPQVPPELFSMADRADRDIARIAGQNAIHSQAESAKHLAEQIAQDDSRFGLFIGDLAEWYSQVGSDSLCLVAEHYTEDRTLQIKGDFGWDAVRDFRGAKLRDQSDVRVFPDSIEPKTRQAVEQRVMNYVQAGFIGREEAMLAIETGSTDSLVAQIVNDETRAGRIIQRLKEGEEALFSMPDTPTGRMEKAPVTNPDGSPLTDPLTGQPYIDPATGQPPMVETGNPEMAPGWMPRYSDNLRVFRATFENWMKTEDYELLPLPMQEAASQIYAAILQLEAEKNAEAAAAQAQQAEQLGMSNATRPPDKPMPSFASANGGGTGTPAPSGP